MLTTAGGVPCRILDQNDGTAADLNTTRTMATTSETSLDQISIPSTLKDQPHGGRPLTSLPEQAPLMDSSSQMDTDIEGLFDADNTIQYVRETPSRKASPQ